MENKEIDYYGDNDNYIHLKFGDCVKMYNFTKDLIEKYPNFVKEYRNYWEGKSSSFKNAFQIISYVYDFKLPIAFYYNFTDTPAKNKKEVIAYLLNENTNYKDKVFNLE